MKLPIFISNCSIQEKRRFLRALFDDEASALVNNKRIQFVLKPEESFNSVRELTKSLDIAVSKVYVSKEGIHKFDIASGDGVRRFRKLIGFKHPTKQQKLNRIIEIGWRFRRYPDNFAKTKILSILKERDSTTKELALLLNRTPRAVREHLKNLKQADLVQNKRIIKQATSYTIWSLAENGKNC